MVGNIPYTLAPLSPRINSSLIHADGRYLGATHTRVAL